MAELLLINPRARRRRTTKARRKNPSAAQRRARAAFAAASRARSSAARAANPRRRRRARRSNPAPVAVRRVMRRSARRANPVGRRHRRRRNPIGLGNVSSYMGMIKEGLIGGAGAVGVDVLYGYITPYLPASLQRTPGAVSVGDAVKAGITIVLGKLLDRPTRGLSTKAAKGALVVQAHGLIAQLLPSTVTLGYSSAAPVANMSTRIGPNRRSLSGVGRYTAPGATQMLGRYTAPGVSQILSPRERTMAREMTLR